MKKLPGIGGMQAAQELRELDKNVRLVFVSASPEYAVESYSVGAYYYLLKPIDGDSFFPLLDKIRGELSTQIEQGFILKSREEVIWIAFARLAYVEVIDKTLYFHLTEGAVREVNAAFFRSSILSIRFLWMGHSLLMERAVSGLRFY